MMNEAVYFKNERLFFIDQSMLPLKEHWCECKTIHDALDAIGKLKVRGAPLLGVFAAHALYVAIRHHKGSSNSLVRKVKGIRRRLGACRPTAVNLAWALAQMEGVLARSAGKGVCEIKKALRDEAARIQRQDRELCKRMASYGVRLIKKNDTVLTHCNSGFLATAGEGTALGVLHEAKRRKKNITVYVDETRPLLQGARLSAWELKKAGVKATLITDSMAGYLMQQKKIDKVFVGSDRITARGDAANKIGTYSIAVLAAHHHIPFYVVAPVTTFDLSIEKGSDIPIEQRNPDEVRTVLGKIRIAPKGIRVYNPAFDVTPHSLITAIVTDRGIIYPPFRKNISKVIASK